MDRSPIRVFISSRTNEFASERRATAKAIADLAREGYPFVEIRAEELPAQVGSPQQVCLEKVRESEIFLGIFGKEFSEPVQQEYEQAVADAKPCLIFVRKGEVPAQIQGWSNGHFVQFFDSADELKYQVYRALRNLIETFLPLYLQRLTDELDRLQLPFGSSAISTGHLSSLLLIEHADIDPKERTGGGPEERKRLRWLSPEDALALHKRWLLVGPGGAGKTTTLHSLTYRLARQGLEAPSSQSDGPLVPVLLQLVAYQGNLLAQVANALEVRGLRCDPSLVKSWLRQGRVVLLLDGFDEASDPRLLAAELEDLVRLSPQIRLVIAARPGAKGLLSLPFPALELDRLTDHGITQLFEAHLGQERGANLFQTLVSANLLDLFRQPLIAWFAALAYRQGAGPILPNRGALYRRVLENDWLGTWESHRTGGPPAAGLAVRIECLAHLGHEMVRRGVQSLDVPSVEWLCRPVLREGGYLVSVGGLLEELCSLRLLERSERGFAFWHLSFRDYFAAVCLERHFRLPRIALLAWSVRWHETLIFLAGLLDEARATRMLRSLFFLAKPAALAGGFHLSWGPNRLFLLLRCLVNAVGAQDALKDRFIDLIAGIPEDHLFLRAATVPVHSPSKAYREDEVYSQFHTHVGELRTAKSFEFLRRLAHQRHRVLGLARSGHPDTLAVLLDEFRRGDDQDHSADRLAASILLGFRPDILLQETQLFFRTADREARHRLLGAIGSAWFSVSRPLPPIPPADDAWVDFFTELCLREEEPDTWRRALSILSDMAGAPHWLPERAESTFLSTLNQSDPELRYRAVSALLRSRSARSLEAIVRAVDDEDSWVQHEALYGLQYRDRAAFPGYVARVVETLLAPPEEAETWLSTVRDGLAKQGVDPAVLKQAAVLIVGALVARESLRRLSIMALMRLKVEPAVPILVHAFRRDESAFVRKEALAALVALLGDGAEPYVEEAFVDDEPGIREKVARLAFHFSPELLARKLPRLRKLLDDPEESVRKQAGVTCYHWAELSSKRGAG